MKRPRVLLHEGRHEVDQELRYMCFKEILYRSCFEMTPAIPPDAIIDVSDHPATAFYTVVEWVCTVACGEAIALRQRIQVRPTLSARPFVPKS